MDPAGAEKRSKKMLALRQFENHIVQEYFRYVVLRVDENTRPEADKNNLRKTRGLVAFYLKNHANCPENLLSTHITDGFGDQGIDGIYYNHADKVLHLVQTKWVNNGNDGLDLGDMHKMIAGVKLLIVPDLSQCNQEIKNLSSEINTALLEPSVKVVLAIVATTTQPMPGDTKTIFESFLSEQNTVTTYLSYDYLNLKQLHDTLATGSIDTPIDAEVLLRNWNDIKEPVKAVYGQINGNDLSALLENHGKRILSPNIRYFLGKTEVNDSIYETAKLLPKYFWYFNNGITAISTMLSKRAMGGSSHESGIFDCKEFYIVNGAQTTGTLLEVKKTGLPLDEIYVNMRIIEIATDNKEFGVDVTRNNNTQNRIDSRDFVSLDPVQDKLYQELILDHIFYTYKSGDTIPEGNDGFSFEEAAIAMACSLGNVDIMVQAKREVSKLWYSIDKPPYKLLFNAGLEGPLLWRNVQLLRKAENWIRKTASSKDGRDRLILVHGNRFLLMLLFIKVIPNIDQKGNLPDDAFIESAINDAYNKLRDAVETEYPHDQVASLFKNNEKCKRIKTETNI